MLTPLTQLENENRIRIGNGCRSGPGLRLSISNGMEMEENVEIGPYVTLFDAVPSGEISGIPVSGNLVPASQGLLRIGERVRIGARATVAGSIHIGKWAVIQSGSVVVSDVPEACRVAGNPAVITAVYDPALCSWEDVSTPQEAEAALARRKNQPLLSICIPTYNREGHLRACLDSIFSQIGATDLVEVVVSDNCSPDGTHDVAASFMRQNLNIRYVRNSENIGLDRNIIQAGEMARGTFLQLHGDDDYFLPGTLRVLLSTLHSHPDCSLIHTHSHRKDSVGEGMKAYLKSASFNAVHMTQTTLRRADWMAMENRSTWKYTYLTQFHWQYEMLFINPKFCILGRNLYSYNGKAPEGYNMGMVGFRNVDRALSRYEGVGLLDRADIDEMMTNYLFEAVMPLLRYSVLNNLGSDVSDFEAYYTVYFNHQPYYEEVLHQLRDILAHGK
ncbi:glycosyltransferase [Paenibacillus enshidis]|uniref:Glycosyltransferase n=1 Tax=Paenibacillus enshidis TaxID=1458439 RepID=A0ABV5AXY1_9BACL